MRERSAPEREMEIELFGLCVVIAPRSIEAIVHPRLHRGTDIPMASIATVVLLERQARQAE